MRAMDGKGRTEENKNGKVKMCKPAKRLKENKSTEKGKTRKKKRREEEKGGGKK